MPSKFRKAIGAVKDQTSISLAKVTNNNASNLEILILRATTHEEIPIDERYVSEILALISSNKLYARASAHFIGKRLNKTRNWVVAIKSLILVLRIFQDGDPHFPKEILHATKRGSKILNLSSFRDDSNKNPWDYTAFVRTYALYLDERLDCFITGKLQRRYTTTTTTTTTTMAMMKNREMEDKDRDRDRKGKTPVSDMKPPMLLDKITHWQLLLDRAIATRPTGSAKTNKLVKISLYTVVKESFDLYKDISDGLALLLDSFFHLQYKSCLSAFHACVKATRQFEELSGYYDLCKSIGIGRTSEYPCVQKISEELVEILHEFLKDQSSFPANGRPPSPSPRLLHSPPPTKDHAVVPEPPATEFPDRYSDFGSYSNSMEDVMSVTTGVSSSRSCFSENCEENSHAGSSIDTITTTIPPISSSRDQQPPDSNSTVDLVMFEDSLTSTQPVASQQNLHSSSALDLALFDNGLTTTTTTNQADADAVAVASASQQNLHSNSTLDLALFDNGLTTTTTTTQADADAVASQQNLHSNSAFDLVLFDDGLTTTTTTTQADVDATQQNLHPALDFAIQFDGNGWELALIEPIQPCLNMNTTPATYNPFLDDAFGCNDTDIDTPSSSSYAIVPFTNQQENDSGTGYDLFSMVSPTFQATTTDDATPSFRANCNDTTALGFPIEDDLFGPSSDNVGTSNDGFCVEQPNLLLQQQLWLQNQDNIISRHVSSS